MVAFDSEEHCEIVEVRKSPQVSDGGISIGVVAGLRDISHKVDVSVSVVGAWLDFDLERVSVISARVSARGAEVAAVISRKGIRVR